MTLLADILSSRVRAEIFRLLFGLTPGELHMREIENVMELKVALEVKARRGRNWDEAH